MFESKKEVRVRYGTLSKKKRTKMGSVLSSNAATVSKVPSSTNKFTDQFQQKNNDYDNRMDNDDDERPQKRHEKSLQTPIVMEEDESDESGMCMSNKFRMKLYKKMLEL